MDTRGPPWEPTRLVHEATQMETLKTQIRKKATNMFRKIEALRETLPQLREVGIAQPRQGNRIKVPLALLEEDE